jgi:heat shock protein HslJ
VSTSPRWIAALLGLLACVALTSCAADTTGRSADYGVAVTPELSDLAGEEWVADGIQDPDRDLVPGSQITMEFTADSVSATAGCNTFAGAASIDDTELVVVDLLSTRMACDEQLAEQDQWLSDFLEGRPTIEQLDEDLWLSRDETTVHLTAH